MKLHSDTLDRQIILNALLKGKNAGLIPNGMYLDKFEDKGSRSRSHAWEIHLGVEHKSRDYTGKMRRRPSNSSNQDELAEYGATYSEWGWFIAFLFEADPDLTFGPYTSQHNFESFTKWQFVAEEADAHTPITFRLTPLTAGLAGIKVA